jgi:lipoprotein-releasing system permease protein
VYKLLLILRYLRKRRIAWVSLIAVTLCTALMLVVISVMGGWLRMFRQSFHGLSGDILVRSPGMTGFPYYDEMIRRIEALKEVGPGNAVPVVRTFGLININNWGPEGVQVLGYPIDKIGNVNGFPQSLYRQHLQRQEAAEKLKDSKLHLTPEDRAYYEQLANDKSPPSFDLVRDTRIRFVPPTGWTVPDAFKSRLTYAPNEHLLIWRGAQMSEEERDQLAVASPDSSYVRDIYLLYEESDFRRMLAKLPASVDPGTWPGIILGEGVARIHKNREGELVGRNPEMYRARVKLTVIGVMPESAGLDLSNKSERPYWVIDDSRTKVYQYDSQTVYVAFDRLQDDLQMTEKKDDDGNVLFPARTSEIDIKCQPGTDLNAAREKIRAACNAVLDQRMREGSLRFSGDITVETWEESQHVWLHAIENEKVLVMFLFGLISIVAVFLIFCIFYMIVVEKTRDIGVIKSVGATSGGVAGIFLGYGLVIGVIGGGLGLLSAWLIVHNINELHAWLGRAFGIAIWDPQVYAFDTIPNTMDPRETSVIVIVAIVSAVLGALLPALRAASLHPVEALRWE